MSALYDFMKDQLYALKNIILERNNGAEFMDKQRGISMYMPVVGDYFTLVRRFSTENKSWINDIFLCTYTDDNLIVGIEQKWSCRGATTFLREDCVFRNLRPAAVAAMLEGHKYGRWAERQKTEAGE